MPLRTRLFPDFGSLEQAAQSGVTPGSTGFAADPAVLAELTELKVEVWRALGSLSEEDREILVLREFQELAYREIAELLGCPQGTVMSRLFTARRRLRAALNGVMP